MAHDNFVRWRLAGLVNPPPQDRLPPAMDYRRTIKMTKHPTRNSNEKLRHDILPFQTIATFYRVKFHAINAHGYQDPTATVDSVQHQPPRKDNKGHIVSARFDTVLVNEGTVLFVVTLASHTVAALFCAPAKPPTHLAYVE
ncbi:hypothetical protein DFH29DRAFT_876998 [Suillus ampliporus]|nr:hypothetical protein DFH29DRAFT_876998 [Suillus ampliporus]